MSLKDFQKELELTLFIRDWSPSDIQLMLIAENIRNLGNFPTKSQIVEIVQDVISSNIQIALEGLDNSDLTTLLMLATKVD